MQLRFTKGVGVALAIAAGCAVLGFVMAPGWWFFAAMAFWLALVLALGGRIDPTAGVSPSARRREAFLGSDEDLAMDPSMRNSYAGNVFSNSELYP